MGWQNLNDVLREDTRQEAEWAAKHAPNLSKTPRGWKPMALVQPEDVPFRENESPRERILRLWHAGYTPTAISAVANLSISRVGQITREERERLGVVQA